MIDPFDPLLEYKQDPAVKARRKEVAAYWRRLREWNPGVARSKWLLGRTKTGLSMEAYWRDGILWRHAGQGAVWGDLPQDAK